MVEDIEKKYQEELERVEEELIGLCIEESYFDFYDKISAKNKKAVVTNIITASTIYSIFVMIFDKVQMLKVPTAAAIYSVAYTLMYSLQNYSKLKKLKKINVLDLEMELYDCYERFKGLNNAELLISQQSESQKDKDRFVKMKK